MDINKKREFVISASYYAVIALIVVIVLKFIFPILTPFIVAFLVAFILHRPVDIITKDIKINSKVASVIIVLMFYSTVGLAMALIGIQLFDLMSELVAEVPALYSNYVAPYITDIFNNLESAQRTRIAEDINFTEIGSEIVSTLGSAITSLSVTLISKASEVATSIPGIFINTVITIISTFFITIDYHKIVEFGKKQVGDKASELIDDIKNYVVGTLWVCIKSYITIMSITFIELSIGLTLIGVENSILLALVIAIFDVLPVLGTGGIMIPWALISLICGSYNLAIGLSIVYIVITVIRNIIEPKIVGGQLGLHPIATLASMFLGLGLIGGIGIFVFPITLSLLIYLNKQGTIKILNL